MVRREKTAHLKQQVIEAADKLFYQKGYNLTSFSDISMASKIPRGNLNYYFKTKDEVLVAVVEYRVSEMKQMLDSWEEEFKTPIERLQRYVKIASNVKDEVSHYGCPMGALNSELAKVQRDLQLIAKEQFCVFESWISKQFKMMGQGKKSAELSLHLLVMTQGLATMTYIHQDNRLIKKEIKFIDDWLSSLSLE